MVDKAWLDFSVALADESRSILSDAIHERQRPHAEVKPDRSFVTALDARIERRLREKIADAYPGHGILGEEEDPVQLDADLVWVLDPIDGTAAFIAGMPVYGTLIALLREGEPVLGVLDLPVTGERWVGVKGSTTLYNGTSCHTRRCAALKEAFCSVSNPDFFDAQENTVLDAVRASSAWRIWGGSCMSYGRLASGRTDIAFDTGLKLWDFAAFRPIIEGAGGVITDWEGRPIDKNTGPRIVAAGDPACHGEMLELIESAMARVPS